MVLDYIEYLPFIAGAKSVQSLKTRFILSLYCSLKSRKNFVIISKQKERIRSNGFEIQDPGLDFIQINPILNNHTNHLFDHYGIDKHCETCEPL